MRAPGLIYNILFESKKLKKRIGKREGAMKVKKRYEKGM